MLFSARLVQRALALSPPKGGSRERSFAVLSHVWTGRKSGPGPGLVTLRVRVP